MSTLLRILHLEDDLADSELIRAAMTADGLAHHTERVASQAEFEAALQRETFDLILADEGLANFNGRAALAVAKALCPEVPFIFVSGILNEDEALQTLREGATDYVFKGRLARLAPAVRRAIHERQAHRERSQAEAQLRQQAERQAQLAAASRAFAAAATHSQQVLALVCRTVHELTGDACTVRLRSPDGRWLQHVVTYHPDPEAQAVQEELKAAPLPIVETIAGQDVRPGESLLIPRVSREQLRAFVPEPLWPLLERFPVHSFLAVPLHVRERTIGALIVTRGVPDRPLTEADQTFLESLADHAALAIENARAYEAEQAARGAAEVAARRTARLQKVTAALTSAVTARHVAEVITQATASTLDASATSVYMLDADGKWLSMVASVGFPVAIQKAIARLPVDGSMPAAEVFRSQTAEWLRSNEEFVGRYPALASTRSVTGNEALAILPLIALDQALGVLSVSFSEPQAFGPDEQEFLQTLADLCAQALERARLYDAERQLREAEQQAHEAARLAQQRLAFLASASAALVESLDYEATLQRLAREMVTFLADWCLIDLLGDNGRLQLVAAAHVEPQQEALIHQLRSIYPPAPDGSHPILQVIRTRQSILAPAITDAELAARSYTAEHLAWLRRLDIRSHIVVPLVARGQALGALSLVRTSATPPYASADLALAEAVARRAALAIDNARLYSQAQALNAFLEQRVHERTAALAEALNTAHQANQELEREFAIRRRAEQRFRHLLETAPDATVIVDTNGRIVLANSQTAVLFGYETDTLLGEPVERLMPERFRDDHQAHRQGYVGQPHPRLMGAGLDLYGRRQDGSEFPIEVSLGPLWTDEGLLVSCAIRDTTQRKQTADELRASRDQLQTLMRRMQAVREEERASLAREVHDELGQQLSGLKMDVAWLRKRLPTDQPQLAERFEAMSSLLDTSIKTVRHIATELRPGLLDDFGLIAAVEWQLREFGERLGLITRLNSAVSDLALPPDLATAVFRVFQESLTNIARHAEATTVTVAIEVRERVVVLAIQDDGRGFDPDSVGQKRSLGLAGMRERVEAFGGTIAIHSLPGQGTAVKVQIPLPEP